jgi:hypothetical protein
MHMFAQLALRSPQFCAGTRFFVRRHISIGRSGGSHRDSALLHRPIFDRKCPNLRTKVRDKAGSESQKDMGGTLLALQE